MNALCNTGEGCLRRRTRTEMPNNHSNASVSEGDALPNRICPMCRNRKNRLQLKLVLRVALARKYNLNPNLKHKKVVHDLLFRPRSLSAVLFRDLTFYNKPIEGMKFFKRLEAQLRLTHSTRDFWVPAPTIKNHFQRKVVNGWAIARKALKQEMIQKKQKKKENQGLIGLRNFIAEMKSVQYLESLLTEPIDLNAYNSIIELDASSIQQFSKNYNSLFSDTELKNFLSVEVSKAGSPADPEIPLVIASNYNQEPASLGKAAPNVMQSNEGRKNIDSGKFPRQCKGTRYQLKQLKPVEPLVTQYKKSNRSNMTNQPQKPIAGSMSSGFTSPKATKKTSEGLKTFADALSRKRNEIGSKRLAEARSPEKEGQKLSKNEISRPAITCVKQMISASKVRQSEQDQTKSETINKDAKAGTSPEHLLRHRGTLDDHSHRMVLGVAHRLSPEKNLSKLENSVLSKIRGILSSGEVVSAPNCCSDVQRDKVIDSRTEAMPRFEPLPSQGTQSYSEKSLQNVTETSKNESSESSGLIGLGNYQKRTCSPIKGSRKTRPDSPQKLLENRDSSLMLRGRFSKGNESAGTAPPQKKSIEGSLDELSNLESRKSVRLCQMSLKEYSSSGMTSSIVTKNGQERRDFSALRRHLEEVSNTGAQGGYFIAKSTPKPIQNIGYHNLLSLGVCKPVNRF